VPARAFETDLVVVEFDEQQDLQLGSWHRCQRAKMHLACSRLGVRDYTRKCGFSKVVIGLSGGVDSSLVAAIATAALGQKMCWAS